MKIAIMKIAKIIGIFSPDIGHIDLTLNSTLVILYNLVYDPIIQAYAEHEKDTISDK